MPEPAASFEGKERTPSGMPKRGGGGIVMVPRGLIA